MGNSRIILDSNIYIAFYHGQDSLHEQAAFLMENLKGSHILLPYCVIQEVVTLLAYRFGKLKADDFINDIRKSEDIFLVDNQVTEEIEFYLKFKQKLSFTDIALVHLAKKHNAMLFTFDKQLLNLYKSNNNS